MILSGDNILSLPETPKIKFLLEDILLSSYETTYFGLTGYNSSLSFKLESGKLYDPNGRYVYSYRTNEGISVGGVLEDGVFKYDIDEKTVVGRGSVNSFNVTGWYLNTPGQAEIYPSFYTQAIDYDIVLTTSFAATQFLSGIIVNNSDVAFTVRDYSIVYYHNDKPDFSGQISGKVPAQGSSGFLLRDSPQLLQDQTFKFFLTLNTNIGDLSKMFTVSRVSGFNGEQHVLIEGNNPDTILSVFSGSGGLNVFEFNPTSGFEDVFLSYNAYSLYGESVDKTATIQFYPVSPTGTGYYTGEYITGFTLLDSGLYETCPVAKFSGYYHVEDISFVMSGILMSSGCTGDIPFYGIAENGYGEGLTGHTVGKTINISGVYDNSTYYVVTGFVITNSGTGYTQAPTVKLNSGVYGDCKDVPEYFGSNQWIFAPFAATAELGADAAYLTGETVCYSGSGDGYYQVSGIEFTNIGSGYDPLIYKPIMHFERVAGDIYSGSGDASGVFSFNTVGRDYSLTGFWNIQTGWVETDVIPFNGDIVSLLEGYTGALYLEADRNDFIVRVNNQVNDYPDSVVLRLIVTPEFGDQVSLDITGSRAYSKDPLHLKKKLAPSGDFIFTEDEELSFFITQEESIEYYEYEDGDGFIYE